MSSVKYTYKSNEGAFPWSDPTELVLSDQSEKWAALAECEANTATPTVTTIAQQINQ